MRMSPDTGDGSFCRTDAVPFPLLAELARQGVYA